MLHKIRNARSSVDCHQDGNGLNLERSNKHRRNQRQNDIKSRNKDMEDRLASIAVHLYYVKFP